MQSQKSLANQIGRIIMLFLGLNNCQTLSPILCSWSGKLINCDSLTLRCSFDYNPSSCFLIYLYVLCAPSLVCYHHYNESTILSALHSALSMQLLTRHQQNFISLWQISRYLRSFLSVSTPKLNIYFFSRR